MKFLSFRGKLQLLFAALGVLAIVVADWQASSGGAEALRQATYERLTAVRETKRRQVERYFSDLTNHVLALSADESSLDALAQFSRSWAGIPPLADAPELHGFYRQLFPGAGDKWFPRDGRVLRLQDVLLARNPHPLGGKDLLLDPAGLGAYGEAHARFHPTLHRYWTAFGFYDIFLIDAADGRVLYTVRKEIDIGMRLTEMPYRETGLARVYQKAAAISVLDKAAIEDYSPYMVSQGMPAAFVAAPMWRAGKRVGVLAIQVSIDEVDRVMTGNRNWEKEGMGKTGQAYVVGSDGLLRSDLRSDLDRRTSILKPRGEDKAPMLRTQTELDVAGLNWVLVAEMEADEAAAPVRALRWKIYGTGSLVAFILMIPAWWLGQSVTEELLRKQEELERLTGRLFRAQEEERSRLARELHDDLTQRLAAVAIQAGRWKKSVAGEELREGLEEMQSSLGQISRDMHGLSRRLHSSTLEELGLVAAMEGEIRALFERGGPLMDLEQSGEWESLDAETKLTLYRIVQEALANIFKHAQANEGKLELRRDGKWVVLRISDDGIGFVRNESFRPGLGLASMEERTRLLGGEWRVDSSVGGGTRIEVRVPWKSV